MASYALTGTGVHPPPETTTNSVIREKFWLDDPRSLFSGMDTAKRFLPTAEMNLAQRLNAVTRFCVYTFVAIFLVSENDTWLYLPVLVSTVMVLFWSLHRPRKFLGGLRRKKWSDGGGGMEDELKKGDEELVNPAPVDVFESDFAPVAQISTFSSSKSGMQQHHNNDDLTIAELESAPKQPLQHRAPSYENPMGNHLPSHYHDDRFPESLSLSAGKWSNVRSDIDVEYYKNMYRNAMDLHGQETGRRSFYTTPATSIPNDREAFQKWCYRPPSVFKESGDNSLRHVDSRYERQPPRESYIISK